MEEVRFVGDTDLITDCFDGRVDSPLFIAPQL